MTKTTILLTQQSLYECIVRVSMDPGAQIRKGNKGSKPWEAHGHRDAAPAVGAQCLPAGPSRATRTLPHALKAVPPAVQPGPGLV